MKLFILIGLIVTAAILVVYMFLTVDRTISESEDAKHQRVMEESVKDTPYGWTLIGIDGECKVYIKKDAQYEVTIVWTVCGQRQMTKSSVAVVK